MLALNGESFLHFIIYSEAEHRLPQRIQKRDWRENLHLIVSNFMTVKDRH